LPAKPRERIVQTTAELVRSKGYAATGLNEITAAARAPKGSMYHYFPAGKEQLGAEAVRYYGELVLSLIDHCLTGTTPAEGMRRFVRAVTSQIEATDFDAGCPVAVTALEAAPASAPLTAATHDAFESWIARIERRLREARVPGARAKAVTVVAAVEGAIVLCRAEQSTEPLRAVGRVLVPVVTG
jgi:TetR/AcrR family transcriptional regulator, lmrAB and yxaGH operons repressor